MPDLEAELSRATRARQLLADAMLVEAFDALERTYIEAWKDSPARDSQAREALWQAVQVVGKVRTHLESVAATGRLAQRQIENLEGRTPSMAQALFRRLGNPE